MVNWLKTWSQRLKISCKQLKSYWSNDMRIPAKKSFFLVNFEYVKRVRLLLFANYNFCLIVNHPRNGYSQIDYLLQLMLNCQIHSSSFRSSSQKVLISCSKSFAGVAKHFLCYCEILTKLNYSLVLFFSVSFLLHWCWVCNNWSWWHIMHICSATDAIIFAKEILFGPKGML